MVLDNNSNATTFVTFVCADVHKIRIIDSHSCVCHTKRGKPQFTNRLWKYYIQGT